MVTPFPVSGVLFLTIFFAFAEGTATSKSARTSRFKYTLRIWQRLKGPPLILLVSSPYYSKKLLEIPALCDYFYAFSRYHLFGFVLPHDSYSQIQ